MYVTGVSDVVRQTHHKPQLEVEQLAPDVEGTIECLAKIQSMLCCQRMKLIFNLITGSQVSNPIFYIQY